MIIGKLFLCSVDVLGGRISILTLSLLSFFVTHYRSRSQAGASHYFRPLKFHGDGTVRQHGPNREEKTVKDVEGYYKMR